MTQWKQPPLAKVYEAFTAVTDGRVRVEETGHATVVSSERDKIYDVEWTDDAKKISSNDNASYWQGYLGYPAIALLLTTGVLRADPAAVTPLGGVDWHALNRRFRRDYDAAVAHVLDDLQAGGVDTGAIRTAAEDVLRQLAALEPERLGPRRRPPKAG